MSAKSIEVEFFPDGTTTINGKGFVGAECDIAMKEIEEVLGKQVSRTNKAEYHKKPDVKQKARQ